MTKQQIYSYLEERHTKHSDIFGNGFKTTKAALIASTICYKNDYRTHVDKPGVDPTTYFAGKKYQSKNVDNPLDKGVSFSFIKRLLSLKIIYKPYTL